MVEITKKDLKGVILEAIEPFAKSVQQDFQKVHSRLGGVEDRLTSVEFDLSEVKKEVTYITKNTGELFTKMDKFIVMYEKQDQELAILGGRFNDLSEQVNTLERRITRLESQK